MFLQLRHLKKILIKRKIVDKIIKLFFGFLLTFGLLIVALWISDVPANATGGTDTTYSTLNHSGVTVASNPTVKWLAYLFGMGIISIFGFMIFIGGRKKEVVIRKKLYRVLAIGIAALLFGFTMLTQSWWNYVETNSMDYFMGLPKPTAWMLFGMMLIPTIITFFYTTKFEEWIYTAEDEERFAEIMANRRKKGGG